MPPTRFLCTMCGYIGSYLAVWRHAAWAHINEDYVAFTCECKRVFKRDQEVYRHLRHTRTTCNNVILQSSHDANPFLIMIAKTQEQAIIQRISTEVGQKTSIVDPLLDDITDDELDYEDDLDTPITPSDLATMEMEFEVFQNS